MADPLAGNPMIRPATLSWGVVATLVASVVGLLLIPHAQMDASPHIVDSSGQSIRYPAAASSDIETEGVAAYRSQGCIYCHSQQVRSPDAGSDIERGWGDRRSVPRDYALQNPPLLGTMRTGPDLANIGHRQPSETWHHLHLYDARSVSPGSIMPPFAYLYSVTSRYPGVMGIALRGGELPLWIVPSAEARALVAYIQSLHQDHDLEAVR